jgi:hypothetical protein
MQIDPIRKAELAQIFFALSNAVNDFRLRPDNFHPLPPGSSSDSAHQPTPRRRRVRSSFPATGRGHSGDFAGLSQELHHPAV